MKRHGWIASAFAAFLAMAVLFVVLGNAATARQRSKAHVDARTAFGSHAAGETSVSPDAFILRFDPTIQSFETFSIPTRGANPRGLAVVSDGANVDVWFTEPGADKIGRLIYTSTQDFAFLEYEVAPGSVPLNLAHSGPYVWFTARAGDYIGRIEISSGEIVTFSRFTANSQPSGIDIAPDGSVWFTERATDKIGRLVVTTTTDYAVKEYPVTGTGPHVGLYGIAVQSDDYVWVGETETGIVRRLNATDGTSIWYTGSKPGSHPYALEMDPTRPIPWFTENGHDQISFPILGSNHWIVAFDITPTVNMRPTGLTILGSNQLWFVGQKYGKLGRMVYTSPLEYSFKLFDLPSDALMAMDINHDQGGHLWTVAYYPQIFLPMITQRK